MPDVTYELQTNEAAEAGIARIEMKLEIVVIPVSDVDRAKEFYERIWPVADRDTSRNPEQRRHGVCLSRW
jgi:hypothetical protein